MHTFLSLPCRPQGPSFSSLEGEDWGSSLAEVFGVSFPTWKNFAAKFLGGEKVLRAQARPGSGPPVARTKVRKQGDYRLKGKGVNPGPGSCGLTVWQAGKSLDLGRGIVDLRRGEMRCSRFGELGF